MRCAYANTHTFATKGDESGFVSGNVVKQTERMRHKNKKKKKRKDDKRNKA